MLIQAICNRLTPYLCTDAGKETQRKTWDETLTELVKVDAGLSKQFLTA